MTGRGNNPASLTPALRKRMVTLMVSAVLTGGLLAGCSSSNDNNENDVDDDTMPMPEPPDTMTPGIPGVAEFPSEEGSTFSEGIVTAAHPLAAAAGAQVLEDGGNAVDAAVVTQFVLNVVEPTSSGIGGGGFMGIYKADEGRVFYIDSREKAPAAATPTQFLNCEPDCTGEETRDDRLGEFTDFATSGIGVGVPGTLLGAAQALEKYGSGMLSLADALAPAIALAENGFEINERLASLTESSRTTFWPETAAKFRTPEGEPLSEGFLLVQPDLARTFTLIAEQGVEVFYTGEISTAIVNAQLRTRDVIGPAGVGRMTREDLAAYLADFNDGGIDEREPVVSDYRGYTINGMPPPSSGGLTVAQILECIEQFPIGSEEDGFGEGSVNTLHVMAESMLLAFSSRGVWMGDNDNLPLPIEGLLSPDYLADRCSLINTDARIAEGDVVPGDPRLFDPAFTVDEPTQTGTAVEGEVGIDTTHFTVIDANGNVVSWTSTIEGTWGSGITVPGYGFLLNNELTDFNAVPQANDSVENFAPGANDVAPNKRPRSSMAPTIVLDSNDAFVAAYGSPGGSTIINSVVNMTVNLIDHGMTVQEAIDAPRISGGFGTVSFEAGFEPETLTGLADLGHNLRDEPSVIGSVQAVTVETSTGLVSGGADDRRAGTVAGLPRP
ncbi:MAG: gamma-glutamyltransferase [Granulosicoccus sp.]